MTKVTIFGAGITGLAIASVLPESVSITIVARDFPGDEPNQDWASPWACAGWVGLGGTLRERQMQLDALAFLRRLAHESPESSARCVKLRDVFPPKPEGGNGEAAAAAGKDEHKDKGDGGGDGVWYENSVPFYKLVPDSKKKKGEEGRVVVEHESVVLDPAVFLVWLKERLESQGVKFQRVAHIRALGELKYLGHDVLINASGAASRGLEDVKDMEVMLDRTYTTVVRSDYKQAFVHRGPEEYTYIFGRGNGTAVVGGISDLSTARVRTPDEVHTNLLKRAHEHLPEHFPSSNPRDYMVVRDLVGIRPLRPAGVRIEAEVLRGQKVIHAYGTTIGGYIFSFGLAWEVARLFEACTSGPKDKP